MKKRFIKIISLLLISISVLTVFCTGCNEETVRSIVSIEKYETKGLTDTYVIKYSDGTESFFEVTNGRSGIDGVDGLDGLDGKDGIDGTNGIDGEDGSDLSVDALFAKYKEEYPDRTFDDFLNDYLTINTSGYSRVVSKLLLSTVKVCSEYTTGETDEKEIAISSGSGVIYKKGVDYTYILTNYHMIYSSKANADSPNGYARKITCFLYGSNLGLSKSLLKDDKGYEIITYSEDAIDAKLIGASAVADIAILRVATSDIDRENPKACEIKYASDYHVGETVIAVGNASDLGISVTQGIISVENENITLSVDGTERSYRSIRLDAFITHGSSGGGLFNTNGELVGITNAGNDTLQEINYAIPFQIVKAVVANLEHYTNGKILKGKKLFVGVTVMANNSRYVYDDQTEYGRKVSDVTVSEIIEGSVASKLGIEIDDILTGLSINGETYPITRNEDIGDTIYYIKAGDKIKFSGLRKGEPFNGNEYTVLVDNLIELE